MSPRWMVTFLLAALPACRTAPYAPPRVPSPPTPAPAIGAASSSRPLPAELRWIRASAEHRALFLQVYRAATTRVETEAAQRAAGSWAVVLDADETVIDTSGYGVERARLGLLFDDASWHAWVTRREAVPLPGAKAFLRHVRELGGRIAIVTNRNVSECPDTEAVFRAQQLAYDVMLCKPDHEPGDKNPRFQAVAQGGTAAGLPPLEIVAFLGDNINDFPGQSQSTRDEGDEAFAAFGERFFVLPNPAYGSWEKN